MAERGWVEQQVDAIVGSWQTWWRTFDKVKQEDRLGRDWYDWARRRPKGDGR